MPTLFLEGNGKSQDEFTVFTNYDILQILINPIAGCKTSTQLFPKFLLSLLIGLLNFSRIKRIN